AQRPADSIRAFFARRVGSAFQARKHFPNLLAVAPFIILDFLNRCFLILVADGFPVPAVRIRGGQLARVSELKQGNETLATLKFGNPHREMTQTDSEFFASLREPNFAARI